MRALWITCCIVVVDQVSKLCVKGIRIPWLGVNIRGMHYGVSKPVFGDFFRLTYIENPGMAFGIDIGGKLFFSLFSILLSIGILYYLYRARKQSLGFRVSLALILGGAIGNLIDRTFYGVLFDDSPLFYGKVVDFFDFDFFKVNIFGYSISRWPVFNVADAAVTVGILLLLFVQHHQDRAESGLSEAVPPVTSIDDPSVESPTLPPQPENSSR